MSSTSTTSRWWAARACSPTGTALKVYTTHEHWLVCPMHVLWRFDRELCERPDCLRCTLA